MSEEHKDNPEANIAAQEARLRDMLPEGATVELNVIPTPHDGGAYIKQQIEFGKMVGAKIDYDPMRKVAPRYGATWLDMPNDHVCSCANCNSKVRPSTERSSPHHYSVAFGDQVLQAVKMVDGKWELIDNAVEVDVDDDSAIRVTKPLHECGNCMRRSGGGGGVCMYRDHGEFGVRLARVSA